MSTLLSAGKKSAILTRVQLNPEIKAEESSYMEELILRSAEWLVGECRLPRYPELSKGFAQSILEAGTDITGLLISEFILEVNGGLSATVVVPVAGANTGALIATAIQTAIQAESTDGWDEVTCVFANTQYVITSGRYGEGSSINMDFTEANKELIRDLGFTVAYGGTSEIGSAAREDADTIVASQVEIQFRKIGIEGLSGGSVPGDISFSMADLDPTLKKMLGNLRRIF